MLPDFLFFCSIFPVQQTPSGIGHESSFFGLATNTLNVRNNNNNNNMALLLDVFGLTITPARTTTRTYTVRCRQRNAYRRLPSESPVDGSLDRRRHCGAL